MKKRSVFGLAAVICLLASIAAVNAFEISDGEVEYSVEDLLELGTFDLFSTFGNEGKEVDRENRTITFKHKDENDIKTYKHFRLNYVTSSDDANTVEIYLLDEQILGTHEVVSKYHFTNQLPDIDWDRAYTRLEILPTPASFPYSHIKGKSRSYSYKRANQVIGTFRVTENVDGLVVKVEFMQLSVIDAGLKLRIETTVPEEPFELPSRRKMREEKTEDSTEQFSVGESEADDATKLNVPDGAAPVMFDTMEGFKSGRCHWHWTEFDSNSLSGWVTYRFDGLSLGVDPGADPVYLILHYANANFGIAKKYGSDGEHLVTLTMWNYVILEPASDPGKYYLFSERLRRKKVIPDNPLWVFNDRIEVTTTNTLSGKVPGVYYNIVGMHYQVEDTDVDAWIEDVLDFTGEFPVGNVGKKVVEGILEVAIDGLLPEDDYVIASGTVGVAANGCKVPNTAHWIPYKHLVD